jgi:hypothetical protein
MNSVEQATTVADNEKKHLKSVKHVGMFALGISIILWGSTILIFYISMMAWSKGKKYMYWGIDFHIVSMILCPILYTIAVCGIVVSVNGLMDTIRRLKRLKWFETKLCELDEEL